LNVPADWDSVIFAQTVGSKKADFWKNGQAKVEIYINNFKVCERFFGVNGEIVEEKDSPHLPLIQKKEIPRPENNRDKIFEEESRSLDDLLKELDSYIGLSSIKQSVRDFISYLEFIKERKTIGLKADDKISINALFLGNPGTGKTTIARLLGNILKAMGIIQLGHVVEVDRAGLVGQYIGETAQKTDKIINDAIGGVLFIDEAYTLVKKSGTGQDFGQEAIDILLKRMEDRQGEFVVIAAGYPEEMNSFLSSNPGIKSRFTHTFNFEDYTPDELLKILDRNLVKEEYKITNDAKKLLHSEFVKLYRKRDKTFGNARIVRNIFEEAKINLGKRVVTLKKDERTKEVLNTITVEDISRLASKDKLSRYKIGIDEELLEESLKELNNLVGLSSVKKEINDLLKLARYFFESGEDISEKFGTHYLFLGNPGTGKTTVARLFSKIFSALGILQKGHLVETDRQGLVAGYIGQTAEKTSSMIDKSLGGTLFIDEAYSLIKKDGSGSDFGKEAIDILLKRMEDDRGKFIVIAAGYTDEMKEFIAGNPGMQSRFQKAFTFDDYIPKEMMEIVNLSLQKDKKKISEEATTFLLKHFNEIYRQRDKKFGNARIVRNILESAKQKLLLRLADIPNKNRTDETTNTITFEDIKQVLNIGTEARDYEVKGDPLKLQEYIDELNSLAGLENVKQGVYKLISGSKIAQLRKERGLQVIDKNLHAVFMGNPGTGKTTVARLFSKILKELGVLEKGHLVEVNRSDLVAGYQGQTAIKTEKIIQDALGGTLFIDEAYTLSRGKNDFGQEAIDTLLKKMEDNKGNLVVIAAGYTNEMQDFLESNPGLRSRFNNIFEFEDYSPRQLLAIAYDIAYNNGYILDEGALQILLEIFNEIYDKRDSTFGNARTARNILYSAISNQEERISKVVNPSDEVLKVITLDDVQSVIF
jgi:SpoVK/Ycf46/Vps4 family AAA+-type ATPase